MSMSGQRRLELERARQEQIRLAAARAECTALLEACEATLRGVRDAATQRFAAEELRGIAATLSEARRTAQDRPDATRAALEQATEALHVTLARAEAKARAWTEAQAQAVGRSRAVLTRAEALAAGSPGSGEVPVAAVAALRAAEAGGLEGVEQQLARADEDLQASRATAQDERVRREVVRGLLRALGDMGFVVAGPQIDQGLVVLEGRLASGRRARFEISLEGRLSFDLDGYEGRACADDMQKVETALLDRFGVRLGPPQVVWKNPDRISQGARDLPTNGTRKRS